jgi:hypothetical protein
MNGRVDISGRQSRRWALRNPGLLTGTGLAFGADYQVVQHVAASTVSSRRGRWLLRSRRAAAARCLRPWDACAGPGHFALRAPWLHLRPVVRARLDPQIHRAPLRPVHPGQRQSSVRPRDSWREQRRRRRPSERSALSAARRPREPGRSLRGLRFSQNPDYYPPLPSL